MSKGTNEVVEGVTRSIEGPWWELLTPSLLEIGHGFSGSVEDHSSLGCRKDQLCPAIGRIGLAFDVAETLEFVDRMPSVPTFPHTCRCGNRMSWNRPSAPALSNRSVRNWKRSRPRI